MAALRKAGPMVKVTIWLFDGELLGRGESESQSDGASLQHERVLPERIVVQLHSSDVSDHLEDQTTEHAGHEAPRLVSDAEEQLREDEDTEEDDEDEVTAKRWRIASRRVDEWACVDRALVQRDVGLAQLTADEVLYVLHRAEAVVRTT